MRLFVCLLWEYGTVGSSVIDLNSKPQELPELGHIYKKYAKHKRKQNNMEVS